MFTDAERPEFIEYTLYVMVELHGFYIIGHCRYRYCVAMTVPV